MWGNYVFHLITIPVLNPSSFHLEEKALMDAASEICFDYIDAARKSMRSLARKHSLEEPSVEPRVNLQMPACDKLNLILRLPVPTRRRGRLEQEILRKYLSILSKMNTDPLT